MCRKAVARTSFIVVSVSRRRDSTGSVGADAELADRDRWSGSVCALLLIPPKRTSNLITVLKSDLVKQTLRACPNATRLSLGGLTQYGQAIGGTGTLDMASIPPKVRELILLQCPLDFITGLLLPNLKQNLLSWTKSLQKIFIWNDSSSFDCNAPSGYEESAERALTDLGEQCFSQPSRPISLVVDGAEYGSVSITSG